VVELTKNPGRDASGEQVRRFRPGRDDESSGGEKSGALDGGCLSLHSTASGNCAAAGLIKVMLGMECFCVIKST
jgi:hypothetical protein